MNEFVRKMFSGKLRVLILDLFLEFFSQYLFSILFLDINDILKKIR